MEESASSAKLKRVVRRLTTRSEGAAFDTWLKAVAYEKERRNKATHMMKMMLRRMSSNCRGK